MRLPRCATTSKASFMLFLIRGHQAAGKIPFWEYLAARYFVLSRVFPPGNEAPFLLLRSRHIYSPKKCAPAFQIVLLYHFLAPTLSAQRHHIAKQSRSFR